MGWFFALGRWLAMSSIGRMVGFVGFSLALIAGAFLRGRAAGLAKARERRVAARLRAIEQGRRIEDRVAARPPAANREELKRWSK